MIRLQRPSCPDPSALATNYKHPVNKAALQEASFDKCMYCESKISHAYYGDVEHIKPKSIFTDLEFTWTNLGFVCAKCNGSKSNNWNPNYPFINPYEEDPSGHIVAIGIFVHHKAGSIRGELTWRVIELNRAELLERRKERIDAITTLIDKAIRTADSTLRDLIMSEIRKELSDECPYAMVSRAAYKSLMPDYHS
jgi:hypothetical protein